MKILVGLGNPGPRYAYNRHNIGFLAVDDIAERAGLGPWRKRFQGEIAEGQIAGQKVMAVKPTTFMNESGRCVGEILRFYKLKSEAVFVFYDELDLAPGRIRIKRGGGSGGHNGIRSIDSHIGQDYWRVRLGIGHPGLKHLVTGHVLSDFSGSDEAWLDRLLEACARHIDLLVGGDGNSYMSRVAHDAPAPKAAVRPGDASEEN